MSEEQSEADRMAFAIEAALPIIRDMWNSFPYAEIDGDEEAITELRDAAHSWREAQARRKHAMLTEPSENAE